MYAQTTQVKLHYKQSLGTIQKVGEKFPEKDFMENQHFFKDKEPLNKYARLVKCQINNAVDGYLNPSMATFFILVCRKTCFSNAFNILIFN